MDGSINVKSSNNISKWQMGFNSAFNGLINYDLTRIFILEANEDSVMVKMFVSSAISKSGHLRVKLSSIYCNLVISYIKISNDLHLKR
jgi:hypothetical protein